MSSRYQAHDALLWQNWMFYHYWINLLLCQNGSNYSMCSSVPSDHFIFFTINKCRKTAIYKLQNHSIEITSLLKISYMCVMFWGSVSNKRFYKCQKGKASHFSNVHENNRHWKIKFSCIIKLYSISSITEALIKTLEVFHIAVYEVQ